MTRVINSEESLGVTVQLPDGNGLRFRDVLRGEVMYGLLDIFFAKLNCVAIGGNAQRRILHI